MKMSIEEQKAFLKDNLEMEDLRYTNDNLEEIKTFAQASQGNVISDYLINKAWHDDTEHNTKVFLIRDKNTREIAFYFAINCGILFSDLSIWNMTPEEKKPFDEYVEAMQKLKESNLSKEELEKANDQYNDSMIKMWEVVEDSDRVSNLLSLAEEKVQILEEKREAFLESGELEHVQQVQETFPAIDIKFFGRNKNYKPTINLDFRLGVFVFWEMIVPHLLEIASKVGCKYIYLFAADNSEEEIKIKEAPMWTPDYDPFDDDEEQEEGAEFHKLVNYYINELKFRYVTKYKILKPHFERTCFTLVQDVDSLQSNRESVWASHINDEAIDE